MIINESKRRPTKLNFYLFNCFHFVLETQQWAFEPGGQFRNVQYYRKIATEVKTLFDPICRCLWQINQRNVSRWNKLDLFNAYMLYGVLFIFKASEICSKWSTIMWCILNFHIESCHTDTLSSAKPYNCPLLSLHYLYNPINNWLCGGERHRYE